MQTETEQITRDKRCRDMHPETIQMGHVRWLRNDLYAAKLGETERTLNLRDRRGAPSREFGGIKYRPEADMDAFLLSDVPKPPTKRRGRR